MKRLVHERAWRRLRRIGWLSVFFAAASVWSAAEVPDYRLGDVAIDDVVAPVPIVVPNPEATGALKYKVAQQVHFIVRFSPETLGEIESDLKRAVEKARFDFLAALQRELYGRFPTAEEVDSAAYRLALRHAARESVPEFPFERFAAQWVRGESDRALLEAMLERIRPVMAQPVVSSRTDSPLAANQSVRLLHVPAGHQALTAAELEQAGSIVSASKILSLWRARRLIETAFPADQAQVGRFAASLLRPNAHPDPELTEVVRARRVDGLSVKDSYQAGQVIVRRGQFIDQKALGAVQVLRQRQAVLAARTKSLEEEQLARRLEQQTSWIVAGVGVLILLLAGIWWRLRGRTPAPPQTPALLAAPAVALSGGADHPETADWQQRALVAEAQAERAHQAIRSGVMGWMRETLFRTLFRHRGELLTAQEKAEMEMRELELRLEQLHTPLQEKIAAYEQRIAELEQQLAEKNEANRNLLAARMAAARMHLAAERERGGLTAAKVVDLPDVGQSTAPGPEKARG